MEMTPEEIAAQEARCSGTAPTRNEQFDRDGYLVISSMADPAQMARAVPHQRGQITYWGKKLDQFNYVPEERQVNGSLSSYNHPQYKSLHSEIRLLLEAKLGRPLYNTYYFDRFYWASQELKQHLDRDACEISVTVHIGTSLSTPWPILIKTPSGEERSVVLKPGDGMVYKGCERTHWRDPMPGSTQPGLEDWYHQIFFHYVLQDGIRAHCAWDAGR